MIKERSKILIYHLPKFLNVSTIFPEILTLIRAVLYFTPSFYFFMYFLILYSNIDTVAAQVELDVPTLTLHLCHPYLVANSVSSPVSLFCLPATK
jgi:hypothetical protein